MRKGCRHILPFVMVPLVAALVLSRCAKEMTTLSGGPKDTIPPRMVESDPPNYSVHFDSREIEVQFNEFIQLQEVQQQFLSSPPFEEDPEINMKGRGFIVELKDTLRDSTTYTLNFGNAIADYTEGNPLRNFKYVFSTGDELDSLQIQGQVYDAFNMKERENVLVMLYDERQDSVPYNKIPDYVSRTDEEGFFSITNIRHDTFKVFALNDMNSNYLYDSPQEDIGFVDSAVTFEKQWIERDDTIYTEKPAPGDTVMPPIDTVIHREYMGYPVKKFSIGLFNEVSEEQYLKSFQRKRPMKLDFVFNRPIRDSLRISLLDSAEHHNWYLKRSSAKGDTMTYWVKDTALYNQEYLKMSVGYQDLDSANQLQWTTDTVELSYLFEEGERGRMDTVSLNTNLSGNLDLNKKIRLAHPYPVSRLDTNRMRLERMQKDSVLGRAGFQTKRVEDELRFFELSAGWKPETTYRLQLLPGAMKTIYPVHHDTLTVQSKTRAEDYYGSLKVELPGMDSLFILQLVKSSGEEEQVIREKYREDMKEGVVSFNYLHPDKYQLKIIFDRNGNRKWDTGDYLEHQQPEKVRYNPEEINIRANWDYDLEWNVGKKER